MRIHFIILLFVPVLFACKNQDHPPYQDLTHFSEVFGTEKYYRLYLPESYPDTEEHYPVIYFFHGWGGRHYKDDNAKLEYEMLQELVNKYQVIMVMWDGSMDGVESRPYNVGNHEDIKFEVQMKDYFPELVAHTDSTYRTLTHRNHRGIIGYSMGGFMSFFLAGKYPHMVCAAVNMTGSPEFFVGHPDNHTLYPVRYAFQNLRDVKVRLHNSSVGELHYLNEEVHKGALWDGHLQYEYEQFEGGHKVDDPGETAVFEKAMKFVANAFENPLPPPEKWSHYELYPNFEVWDYQVKSNKQEPGFIYLKNVAKEGFGVYSHKWLPYGPPIPSCSVEVTTAPVYQPNTSYHIIKYERDTGQLVKDKMVSDEEGKLQLAPQAGNYETGIYATGAAPDFISLDYALANDQRYLRAGKENNLSLQIFNRGGEVNSTQKIKVTLTPMDSSVSLAHTSVETDLQPNERIAKLPPFTVHCTKTPPLHGEPPWVRFRVNISLDTLTFEDELMLPVFFDVPVFDNIQIDDGLQVRDSTFGRGNADGVAAAGEEIMVYVDSARLRLYTDDPYVLASRERLVDEVLPARWPDGFTLSSVIRISDDCPDGHVIECLASYETKTHMPIERQLTWGKVEIKVDN